MARIEIDKNKVLNPGDVIELHFKTTSMLWIQSTQIAMIEWRFSKRKDWQIISNSLPQENIVIFTILVKEQTREIAETEMQTASISITAAVIAAAIIGCGIVAWLTLDKIYQIGESPAGKLAVGGTGVGIAAAGIAALLFLILPRK